MLHFSSTKITVYILYDKLQYGSEQDNKLWTVLETEYLCKIPKIRWMLKIDLVIFSEKHRWRKLIILYTLEPVHNLQYGQWVTNQVK